MAIESKVVAIESKVVAIEYKVVAIEYKVVAIESKVVAIESGADRPKFRRMNGVRERRRVSRLNPGITQTYAAGRAG